jgi:hypothetical protein
LHACRVASSLNHVVEVHAPLVDHASILQHPIGLAKLSELLQKMDVPYTGSTTGRFGQALLALLGRRRRLFL